MSGAPLLSVILPAYNAQRHVPDALQSIIRQTVADWECLVVDDGSTDGTADAVARCNDPRIRLLQNEMNRGIVFSLNRGLSEARGRYIARMDADDISLSQRFERQVSFLEAHPEVGLCGSWAQKFIPCGPRWLQRAPMSSAELKVALLFATPFVHPSVMLRRSVLTEHGLRYAEGYDTAEDYRLWCELASVTEMTVIPEVLLKYRVTPWSITGGVFAGAARRARRRETLQRIWGGFIEKRLGFMPDEAELDTHALFYEKKFRGRKVSPEALERARQWIAVLCKKNEEQRSFDREILTATCERERRFLATDSLGNMLRRVLLRFLG